MHALPANHRSRRGVPARRAGPLLGAMLAALLPTRDASWQRDRDICHVRRLLSGCCLASIRCPIPSAPRPLGLCQLARRHAARLTVRSGDVAHASDGAGSGRKRSSSAYADQVQERRRAREWVGGSVGPHLLDAALGEPGRSAHHCGQSALGPISRCHERVRSYVIQNLRG